MRKCNKNPTLYSQQNKLTSGMSIILFKQYIIWGNASKYAISATYVIKDIC